jgi:hypothetical protein
MINREEGEARYCHWQQFRNLHKKGVHSMWRNKKWALAIVLAVVVILAVGVIGGVVYAQSGPGTPANNTGDKLMAKVAEKLGISQDKLETAFKDAQKELREEALSSRLDKLVEEGKITQEQADKYQEWWQSRPDVPVGPDACPGFCPQGPMQFKDGPMPFNGGMRGFHGKGRIPPADEPDSTAESN